jgi:hypothetical protein
LLAVVAEVVKKLLLLQAEAVVALEDIEKVKFQEIHIQQVLLLPQQEYQFQLKHIQL